MNKKNGGPVCSEAPKNNVKEDVDDTISSSSDNASEKSQHQQSATIKFLFGRFLEQDPVITGCIDQWLDARITLDGMKEAGNERLYFMTLGVLAGLCIAIESIASQGGASPDVSRVSIAEVLESVHQEFVKRSASPENSKETP